MYTRALFLFHRDLRLFDNIGLLRAGQAADELLVCFIIDPRQVGVEGKNNQRALQFMYESLCDLEEQVADAGGSLLIMYGHTDDLVKRIIVEASCDALFSNYDYTPFSVARDHALQTVCAELSIPFLRFHDAILCDFDQIKTGNGKPYSMFTPFYKKALQADMAQPKSYDRAYQLVKFKPTINNDQLRDLLPCEFSDAAAVRGGRREGLKMLRKACSLKNYEVVRDDVAGGQTTLLSAYIKFGCLSIREVFDQLCDAHGGKDAAIVRQLYWRDFFYHIAYHYPHVFRTSFHEEYVTLACDDNPRWWKAWTTGMTGFPIVDAGMRQLNQTGYMHNRVRMITASFWTKDLHGAWYRGERYFAQRLIDYDHAVNNGNWQWAASTGCDAQPYFRIFNPWLQQQKFDPHARYIKRWIPELATVAVQDIHRWHEAYSKYEGAYPAPIVDHHVEREEALSRYKACR